MTSEGRSPTRDIGREDGGPVGERQAEPSASARTPRAAPAALPTMRDIALRAGVSQSTVSRVLNDAPTRVPIADETRERVKVAAQTLGYRPNPLARALRGAPTMLMGAVVREFSDPFFASVIETLAVEAMANGYNLVLGHAHGRLDESIALSTVLETRHTDAIILLGYMQDQPRLLEDLRGSRVPVVALWQGSSPIEFPTMNVDDRAGIMIGLEHLVGLGHRRIGFVSAELPGGNPTREDAYREFMNAHLGGVPEGYVLRVPNSLPAGEAALLELLSLARAPTAIVASTDLAAVGVLRSAYSSARMVPRDLSVIGYDDLPIAAHTVPALTTLQMPITEMVRSGVRLAIELARDPGASREPRTEVFRPALVVRESTARPAADSG